MAARAEDAKAVGVVVGSMAVAMAEAHMVVATVAAEAAGVKVATLEVAAVHKAKVTTVAAKAVVEAKAAEATEARAVGVEEIWEEAGKVSKPAQWPRAQV